MYVYMYKNVRKPYGSYVFEHVFVNVKICKNICVVFTACIWFKKPINVYLYTCWSAAGLCRPF